MKSKTKSLSALIDLPKSGFWGDTVPSRQRSVRVKVVTNGDVQQAESIRVRNLPRRYFSKSEYHKSKLTPGDIVITTSGEPGSVARFTDNDDEVVVSNFVKRLKARSGVDPSWLFYALRSSFSRSQLGGFVQHSVIANLSRDYFERLQLPDVPYNEQKKISSIFTQLDSLIEKSETLVRKYGRMRAGLIQDLFSFGLQEDGSIRTNSKNDFKRSALGVIPKEWTVKSLKELCSIKSGATPTRSFAAYWNGEHPWVSAKDMKSFELHDSIEHITDKAIRDGYQMVNRGSILIVTRGMILAHTFPVGMVMRPVAFNQDLKALICNEAVDHKFLAYWMVAKADSFLRLATSATHGTKKLDTEDIENFLIALPTKEEQVLIANKITDFDRLMSKETSALQKLKELKKGLVDDLLTGVRETSTLPKHG